MSESTQEKPTENVPGEMAVNGTKPRPMSTRLLLALFLTATITGFAFWSGYSTLRGPYGWVGERRFVSLRLATIEENLQQYHDERGEYPETLRVLCDEIASKHGSVWDDETCLSWITIFRHPVIYERTETGWTITTYGADGQPGGIGLDIDMTVTDKTDIGELMREFYRDKKYHATFEQLRMANDGSYFRKLVGTSCVFGFLVFLVTFGIVNLQKNQYIGLMIASMIAIAIPAVLAGIAIMGVHNIATGH